MGRDVTHLETFPNFILSLANAAGPGVVYPYSNPASRYVFSYDLNQPGPTMTCNGSSNATGTPFQQNTQWSVVYSNGTKQVISSISPFALSQERLSIGGFGQTNLTVLNVTNILDGATISCGISVLGVIQQIASFTVKIYSKRVEKNSPPPLYLYACLF